MKGFRDFILRGNLVELAVAFIMATALAAVVTAFVTMIMDVIGQIGGLQSFSSYSPHGVHLGAFITSVVAFVILAAVVYFLVVIPYTKARERLKRHQEEEPTPVPADVALLQQIRDLLEHQETGGSWGV